VRAVARRLISVPATTADPNRSTKMFIRSLLAMTDARKRMAILTLITYISLC
jgi:hypothetical protein